MKKIDYPGLDETVYRGRLPNGLEICVIHKPGFSRKCAYFVTNYGSVHMNFTLDGNRVKTPDTARQKRRCTVRAKCISFPRKRVTGASWEGGGCALAENRLNDRVRRTTRAQCFAGRPGRLCVVA